MIGQIISHYRILQKLGGGGMGVQIPLKRLGKSEEVAAFVAFLASDECSYCTGDFRHQWRMDHVMSNKVHPTNNKKRERLSRVSRDKKIPLHAVQRGGRVVDSSKAGRSFAPRVQCYGVALAWIWVLLLAMVAIAGTGCRADDRNPMAGDPKAVKAGEYEFRINCALCHGLGARGGGRGPDLTRAQKMHARSDAEMFQTISNGISGTAMPANGTNGQGVGMTDEEIWQIITYIRSVEVKAPVKPLGNAMHGKELFYGDANCSLCHRVEGKGGRRGPDLTAIGGSHTGDAIIDSVRNPSRRLAWGLTEATKEFPQEYETVTVMTADGKEIKGVALNEDSFSVQIMDDTENIYLLDKEKLRSFQKSRDSMMPRYDADVLSDKELEDIVSYLISVGAK